MTRAEALADLNAVFRQLAADHPETNRDRSAAWHPLRDGHPQLQELAPFAWLALGLVGLVVLIACFNVAGLMLARAAERQKEIALRAALGAGRGRLLRQMITEGTLLAALSGAASLVLAAWSADLLSAFSLPSPIPQRLHLGIDARLVAYTAALVAVAGVLPALLPALQATRADLSRSMKFTPVPGGRPSRVRNLFVVAQVAGSTLFLAAALLFVRSFTNQASFDTGFDTAHTMVLNVNPVVYGYDGPRTQAFFDSLQQRIAAIPGVRHVALGNRVPFYIGFPPSEPVATDGTDCRTVDCRRATVYAVTPGHFSALGIPLKAGRDFTPLDVAAGTAVVISEQMAALSWPGQPAVGQSFRIGREPRTVEVIGVAADIKQRNMREAPVALVYRPPRDRDYTAGVSVVVRTAGDPRTLLPAVQSQVRALDATLPSRTAQTMLQRMAMPLWPSRTLAGFLVICGTLALVLATVGLFGVTYYAVAQRTREFGIRVAVGATPRQVVALVLREGLTLTAPGVLLGIVGALVIGRPRLLRARRCR